MRFPAPRQSTMLVLAQRALVTVSLTLAASFYAAGQGLDHRLATTSPTAPSIPVKAAARPPVATQAASSVREFGWSDERADARNSFGASLLDTTKTPFLTQSTVPLVRAFRTRLQMSFVVTSTSHKNLMMGPLVPSQTTLASAQARSEDSYGLSLNVPLGRSVESEGSRGLWRGISQVLHR
jgi:hypothetical protein